MAFSQVAARLKSWAQKAHIRSKPSLGLSLQALATFAKPTINLTTTSIRNLTENHFGHVTSEMLQGACQGIEPQLTIPDPTILNELIRLMVGMVSVNIKKNHTSGGDRIDHDNDLLVCIEIFSSALQTELDDDGEIDILDKKISWKDITCDVLGLEFETDDQFTQFQSLTQKLKLSQDHELSKLDPKTAGTFRDANRLLSKTILNPSLFQAGIIFSCISSQFDVSNCYGGLLFLLAFSFSRTETFKSASWIRRSGEIQRTLLQGNGLLTSLSEGSARELSRLLAAKIQDGLDPGLLYEEIIQAVSQGFTHIPQLVAVSTQSEYKGLTPIQNISRALSERTEIPWAMVLEKFPILAKELGIARDFLKMIGKDKFAGMKYGGISRDIRNLQYFCTKVLIIMGGEESLKGYAGFGGEGSTTAVPLKLQLDAWIEKMKETQAKKAQEINIDEVDSSVTIDLIKQMSDITDFFHSQQSRFQPPDDDDDDDNTSQPPSARPGPSAPYGFDVTDTRDQDDQDDDMSSISAQSATKRRSEVEPHTPKTKRTMLEAPMKSPMLLWDPILPPSGKMGISQVIQFLNTITIVSPAERVKTKTTIQLSIPLTKPKTIKVFELPTSSTMYQKPMKDLISTLGQTATPVIVQLIPPSRIHSDVTEIPIHPQILVALFKSNEVIADVPLHIVVMGWIAFLFVWGSASQSQWDADQLIQGADDQLSPLLNLQRIGTDTLTIFFNLIYDIVKVVRKDWSFSLVLQ